MLLRPTTTRESSSKFARSQRGPTTRRTQQVPEASTTRRSPNPGAGTTPSEKENHIKRGMFVCSILKSAHGCYSLSDPGIHQPTMDALPRWILEMEENSREPKT